VNRPFQPPAAQPVRYPFTGNEMFVRNAWYVAAVGSEIGEAPTGRTVLGEPLVLYRTAAGEAVCLEGACPHRQYPLAQAWKEGDQLRCPYHGLRFGPDGRCTEIPSQAEIPPNCFLRRYPVLERWPWVWVWMGDPEHADPSLAPDAETTWLRDEASGFVAEPLPIAGRYPLLTENLLDLSHIPFLHQKGQGGGWARGTDWPEEQLDAASDGAWLRGTRVFELPRHDLPPEAGLSEPAELTLSLTYYPPTFFVGRLAYRALGAGDGARPEIRNIHAFTPVNARETIYHFASGRNFALGNGAVTAHYRERYRAVLEDDKAAAELIEPMVDRPGRRPDFVARADRSAIRGRRALQAMIDVESDC